MCAVTVGVEEAAIAEHQVPDYSAADLRARRCALSLWPEDLAALFGVDVAPCRIPVPGEWGFTAALDDELIALGAVDELIAMEAFVAGETDRLLEQAPAEGSVVLNAVVDQDLFARLYPQARADLCDAAYPVSLQHVAVGRAAAELSRRDRDVEVFRGERRFDLTAARLAVGLGKTQTAYLLGLNKKTYYGAERGVRAPAEQTLNELQDIDDFIDMAAARLEVRVEDAVSVIRILDDQVQFEQTYPEARVLRSGAPYPVRVLRVAAGRRAHCFEAARITIA